MATIMRSCDCRDRIVFASILTLFILFSCLATNSDAQTAKNFNIYLSADRTGAKSSGISIEQGIRTALSENGNQIGGIPVTLKILDHRGSTPRAKAHLKTYLKDPDALVLFGGLHSPPLLATRELINTRDILVLVPWAAATPITRYPARENWIFRLSVDDSKAGYVITQYAVDNRGVKQPALLLEDTGWGKANANTMTDALGTKGLTPVTKKWFKWGLPLNNARMIIREINRAGADSIFMVANATEGKTIASAMASLPEADRLPIFSHWGITGGDFADTIDHQTRSELKLNFIQTSFSFLSELSPFQQSVLETAQQLYPEAIKAPADIKAPSGFIHAYDLTRLLIAAADNVAFDNDIISNRKKLRNALEHINQPVMGLIKTYQRPFSEFSENNKDAHEALGFNDFVMGHYGANNEIILDTH